MRDDDELGDRLEEAFRSYAGDAPRARTGALVVTARQRIRRRRQALIGTAAAVLAVVAIGGTWSALGGPDVTGNDATTAGGAEAGAARDNATAVPDPASSRLSTKADLRTVSYRDVEVSVPASWPRGISGTPWCGSPARGQIDGEVGLPGPVQDIDCPSSIPVAKLGRHVWLSPTELRSGRSQHQLGDGWVRDTVVLGGIQVEVQTHREPVLRQQILASIRLAGR